MIYAGRISSEKGIHVLVEAFRQLAERRERCHLIVLGSPTFGTDPTEAQRYTDRVHTLAAGLPVSWIPRRTDVVPILQCADVAVVPSLWPEPLSRSVIEPLACGMPVVATRVGGTPEILHGWLDRYLVQPGDVAGLADCLESLYGWRERNPGLEAKLRHAAESRLSPSDELEAIESAMRNACRRRLPPD